MRTVEFESQIYQGVIKVPEEFLDLETRRIKVIAIVEDEACEHSQTKMPVDEFRNILALAKQRLIALPDGIDIIALPEEAANDIF